MHPTTPIHEVHRRMRYRVVAASIAVLLSTAACSSDDKSSGDNGTDGSGKTTTTAPSEEVLGTPNAAEGEPLKIGFVSDGQAASFDDTAKVQAADAVVKYLNDYRAGFAGRPIDLVKCETGGEQGKAADCANELIQEGVVMTVMPDSLAALGVYNVMSEENLPLFVFGVTDQAILTDAESTFQLVDPLAGLSALPIEVAQDNGVDKVSAVIIDVPAATAFYQTLAPGIFEEAGIKLDMITVPPGTADLTPQMAEIANGGPTVVHIIGDESMCIAALNGLAAAGYDGPVDTLWSCVTDAVKTAVGDRLKGVVLGTPSPLADLDDPGMALMTAIFEHYDAGIEDTEVGAMTFMTLMAVRDALDGLTGDVTSENIISTIKAMPEKDLLGGGGLKFRCNGKAQPLLPAICTRGALKIALDADGEPVLPYEPLGSSPIPD